MWLPCDKTEKAEDAECARARKHEAVRHQSDDAEAEASHEMRYLLHDRQSDAAR